jgi:SAM-dependent methyltransferase
MEFAGVDQDSSIIDIGCGSGRLLRRLEQHGFSGISGADPFVADDFTLPGGTPVLRSGVDGLAGEFDLVMFNHSFEHTVDPLGTLKAARERLKPGGRLLLRIPVVAEAFAEFGTEWVQIDAPRHLHLQTVDGMHHLAQRAGFRVTRTLFDSNAFQFWGSRQCSRGIPLASEGSYTKTRFSLRPSVGRTQIVRDAMEARRRNRWSTGDQAGFLLALDQ